MGGWGSKERKRGRGQGRSRRKRGQQRRQKRKRINRGLVWSVVYASTIYFSKGCCNFIYGFATANMN